MRVRAVIASAASAALALVGLAAPASAIASPYDTVTVSSMNNLVTAMESYALFDGNDLYTGVTATALSDWGWTPGSSTAVQITIEGDGQSWHAIGQDTHTGTRQYTYTSTYAINGVSPGGVGVSSPQPLVVPTTAGVMIHDVGDQLDTNALTALLVAGGVTLQQVCDETLFFPAPHTLQPPSSLSDATRTCEAGVAAGASMGSVLAAIVSIGGLSVVAAIAIATVGDGTHPAAAPPWVGSPEGPQTPRPVPLPLPNSVWKITNAAGRFAAQNQLDPATAQVAVQQCMAYVANAYAGLDPYDQCSKSQIFMPGQLDAQQAIQHDIEALAQFPAWVQLNYRAGANNPSPRTWENSDPICVAANQAGLDCDEFPYYATAQGGGLAVPLPSLKGVDPGQNQLLGMRYGTFLADCKVNEGDPFLVIPVPPTAPTVPTLEICNGH